MTCPLSIRQRLARRWICKGISKYRALDELWRFFINPFGEQCERDSLIRRAIERYNLPSDWQP
jgi:hypothetical protein